jgi:hypothetical protein
MFKLEDMEPVPKEWLENHIDEDGTFNPFHYDLFNMGKQFSKDIYFMCRHHDSENYQSGYFVNVRTGERQRLVAIE